MSTIRCKSCGRVYQYEKNGTCPKCGAYNRPPRKEIVEADGTVHYVTTEDKVCYEQKECCEEQARQSTGTYEYTPVDTADKGDSDARGTAANVRRQKRRLPTANGRKKVSTLLGAIAALIGVAAGFMADFHDNLEIDLDSSWENQVLIADVGDEIPTENGTVTVSAWQQSGDEVQIDLWCDDTDDLTLSCYYEAAADSGYLDAELLSSDGGLCTYLVSLPGDVNAEDCAVVLDIPSAGAVTRYRIWLGTPVYEIGESFTYCGHEVYMSSFSQEDDAVRVEFHTEDEPPSDFDAQLTVQDAAGEFYWVSWQGMQSSSRLFSDGSTLCFDFTLYDREDIPQSITLIDPTGNQQQIRINLP